MDTDASLIETLLKLDKYVAIKDDFSSMVLMLELAVQTLGRIKTVFENTCKYWKRLNAHCKSISDDLMMAQEDLEIWLADDLKISALNWFVLGRSNYIASIAIGEFDKEVDAIMSNLPTTKEAPAMIENIKKELLRNINFEKEENC